jgi:rhodanese-related sulfurtransferase
MKRGNAVVGVTLFVLTVVTTVLAAGSPVTDVTVRQAHALMQERSGKAEFVILDVRTPGEFAEGHLAGAVNLDIQAPNFETRLQGLDRTKTYLVYCRTGSRSQKAIQTMERLGFQSVFHMTDGIVGWQQQKLPLARPS